MSSQWRIDIFTVDMKMWVVRFDTETDCNKFVRTLVMSGNDWVQMPAESIKYEQQFIRPEHIVTILVSEEKLGLKS